jgi:hypothetical protein
LDEFVPQLFIEEYSIDSYLPDRSLNNLDFT